MLSNRVNLELNSLFKNLFLIKKYNIKNYYEIPQVYKLNLNLAFKVTTFSLNKKYLLNSNLLEFISGQKVSVSKIKYIYYMRKRYIFILYKVTLRKYRLLNFIYYFRYSIYPEYIVNNLKKSKRIIKLNKFNNTYQIHVKDIKVFDGLDDIFYNLKNYIHIQFCIKNIDIKNRLNILKLLNLN